MTRILLVRHGQSEWNAQQRWQGQADPPLSALGYKQALAAAERIGMVDSIVASDLVRAVETARVISNQLGIGPVALEPRFRERDAGEWSGLTRDEIEVAFPGYLEEMKRPESWESDESLLARLHDGLSDLEAQHRGEHILVVAHGGLVYALETHHGLAFERLPNLGARSLVHHGSRIELGERVLLIDDEHMTTTPAQI